VETPAGSKRQRGLALVLWRDRGKARGERGSTQGDACPLPPQHDVNRILLPALLSLEPGAWRLSPTEIGFLWTVAARSGKQAAVPESAEGMVCRRGGGKSPKIEQQTESAAPNTTDAILARLTDEERTCSFRAQRCQRKKGTSTPKPHTSRSRQPGTSQRRQRAKQR
jgi:hypothetical protein